MNEDIAKYMFKQLIEGLHYIHSKNIVHRDIKLDNILLDNEGNIKIGDFGVSKLCRPGEMMMEQCGTPAYIAPEILKDKGYRGFGVDVWSAGVVLYSMLYGTVPFKGASMAELHKLIIGGKFTMKDDVSPEARSLIKRMLEVDQNKRITTLNILEHPWFKGTKEHIDIFTDTEKNIIEKEFTYNDTRRLNRNNQEHFTEHGLDSTCNSLIKNCSTKSVILAPFNSTKTHLSSLHSSIMEAVDNDCLVMAPRCRDRDRQYQNKNNCELDNGVYNKFVVDPDEGRHDPDKEKSIRLDESEIQSDEEEEKKAIDHDY